MPGLLTRIFRIAGQNLQDCWPESSVRTSNPDLSKSIFESGPALNMAGNPGIEDL
jgi:hypothetical protein